MPKGPVNIVCSLMPGMSLSEECQCQIKAVSHRIELWDISDLVHGERTGDFSARERLDTLLADAEILMGFVPPPNVIARAPKMKWIQALIAGADQFLTPDVINSPVLLTKARIHAIQISETVFNMMLMLARRSLEHFHAQQQKKRVRLVPTILHSKTIGILGLGNIGQAVARLAKAFGMRVIAMKAHPEGHYKYVDLLLPPSGLPDILSQSDFLAIILPITPKTRNLIGEAELRLMKPTAYLINVGRGGIVDDEALVRALSENRLAGAALDVFATDPDPLPDDSKFWDLPNVIMTPHNAGHRADYNELVTEQFCQNLKRYLSGKELMHLVDKKERY